MSGATKNVWSRQKVKESHSFVPKKIRSTTTNLEQKNMSGAQQQILEQKMSGAQQKCLEQKNLKCLEKQ